MKALLVVLIRTVWVVSGTFVEFPSNFRPISVKSLWCLTKIGRKLDESWTKVRPKFDQSSTKVRRKFGFIWSLARFRPYFIFIQALASFCLYFTFIWPALANLLRNLNLRHAPSDPSRCDSMFPFRAAFQIQKSIPKCEESV